MSEARTGKRFPLRLPIHIHSTSAQADGSGEDSTTTENLSASGVFIHAATDLEIGSRIEFDITLPARVVGGDCDVAVHCIGRVVRLEQQDDAPEGKHNGVACVIDEYEFIRHEGTPC